MSPERAIHDLRCHLIMTLPLLDFIGDETDWNGSDKYRVRAQQIRTLLKDTDSFREAATIAQLKDWEAERVQELNEATHTL